MAKPIKIDKEVAKFMDPVLALLRADLEADLYETGISAYISGAVQVTEYAKTKKLAKSIVFEGPPAEEALAYAEKHTADLIKGLDEVTKSQMSDLIKKGIKEKRGIDGLARDIRKTFLDMSRNRSRTIAQTETADALSAGSLDRMAAMGIDGKAWVTFHPCPICEANEAAGIIPLDAEFPSGHKRVPAHPKCNCANVPGRLPKR